MSEGSIRVAPGPNSDFGRKIREREADDLYRASRDLPANAPIDPLSEDYQKFWGEYLERRETQEAMKEYFEKRKLEE